MARDTWFRRLWKPKPDEIIVMHNVSENNIALNLPTGRFRLDKGTSRMMAANVLEDPTVKALIEAGKIRWEPFRRNGR
ncbi:MAG: hypothetical protein Kow0047_21470 [Anaerolineae bacterium]